MNPTVVLRLGSHAEKEYVQKLGSFFDGLIIGANLLEATPGATASLLVSLGERLPYYIDPMTYAFGEYVDRDGRLRQDLDWIRSDQKVKVDGRSMVVRDFKRSYKKLARALGPTFAAALTSNSALSAWDFETDASALRACETVIQYQLDRVRLELSGDEELADVADAVKPPEIVFAPYFYLEPSQRDRWFDANLRLMRLAAKMTTTVPVHGVLCADASILEDGAFVTQLAKELPETGLDGVWLWLSGFFEEAASLPKLRAFRDLVKSLSRSLAVYNMHGGWFSLALNAFGLTGTSHGIGYGEQKDVVPVIGQSTPAVRYYLPPLHRRLGVPQIERCFYDLGVAAPTDFHEKVCDCVVCKGVVRTSITDFQLFGEMHMSTPRSKRLAQTPAAAKRCRFHFLTRRVRERDRLRAEGLSSAIVDLDVAATVWCVQPSLAAVGEHVSRWKQVLGEQPP